jgi:hypothetical protein
VAVSGKREGDEGKAAEVLKVEKMELVIEEVIQRGEGVEAWEYGLSGESLRVLEVGEWVEDMRVVMEISQYEGIGPRGEWSWLEFQRGS